ELNMEDIPIPVPVSTPVYKKFEENNPDISLCIYEWHNQNKCLEFRYLSERRRAEFKELNLLVISETENMENPDPITVISTEKGFNKHRTNPKKCLGVNNAPQLPKVPIIKKSIKEFNNHKCMQPNPY
ncbi:683_t:CDS:2, partial [Gigaspora margarita]